MGDKEKIIGIDLGTTNSEVAFYSDGELSVFEVDDGKLLPSYVGIDDDGQLLIGGLARNQYAVYPERTIKSIKRKMGSDEQVTLATKKYYPQEIAAIILRRLKDIAEENLGEKITKAVITVPAFFSDIQRQATREAGEIAGLEVLKIINEPTAAALVYESGKEQGKQVLVYDLGGGTFDVSVVRMEDGVVEVVTSHGDNHLGGDDFDEVILNRLLDHLRDEYDIDDPDARVISRLRHAAEKAKIYLSSHPFADIKEEFLLEKEGNPIHLSFELSRSEYEEMITPLIDTTIDAVHIALRDGGLTASDIDEIVLVGGSTRTPLVRNRLEDDLKMAPRSEVDPDLCVAAGAAMQAAILAGEEVDAVLVDITPYTFGTSSLGEVDGMPSENMFVPLIKKNSPIPVGCSEVFFTVYPGQECVSVSVFQGENQDSTKNIEIGEFLVRGLSTEAEENEIVISFNLDVNGLLSVEATEKKTGLAKSITINNAISRFENDELNSAREKIVELFGVDNDATGGEDKAESHPEQQNQPLIDKARAMLDKVEDDDRQDMVKLLEEISDARAANDSTREQEAALELSEIIFYLEN